MFSFIIEYKYLPELDGLPDSGAESSVVPNNVKIIPVCEFGPTAVTTILPEPSITWVPASNIGSRSIDFLTRSDSPVSEDSSIFRSFDCNTIPSVGSKSPYFTEQKVELILTSEKIKELRKIPSWGLGRLKELILTKSFTLDYTISKGLKSEIN